MRVAAEGAAGARHRLASPPPTQAGDREGSVAWAKLMVRLVKLMVRLVRVRGRMRAEGPRAKGPAAAAPSRTQAVIPAVEGVQAVFGLGAVRRALSSTE